MKRLVVGMLIAIVFFGMGMAIGYTVDRMTANPNPFAVPEPAEPAPYPPQSGPPEHIESGAGG